MFSSYFFASLIFENTCRSAIPLLPPQEYSYFKTTAPKALKSQCQSLMHSQIEDEAQYAPVFNLLSNHRRLIIWKIGNCPFEKLHCVLKE